MMILRLLIVFLLFNLGSCKSQDLKMKLMALRQKGGLVEISLVFKNLANEPLLLYKSIEDAVCCGLVKIEFKSDRGKYEWYPCTESIDLDKIIANSSNTEVLLKNKNYEAKLLLELSEITPKIPSGNYQCIVTLDYTDVEFETEDSSRIFKGRLVAENELEIKIED